MGEPYYGEIRMVGFDFAPPGWALCDGTLLSIAEYEVLFALIGTTYGGDGVVTFALPDLRSRVPVHMGTNPSTGSTFGLGLNGGQEGVYLSASHIPPHSHTFKAHAAAGSQPSPQGGVWAASTLNQYTQAGGSASMRGDLVQPSTGNLPHDNMMPFTTVNFIIALDGYWPQQP